MKDETTLDLNFCQFDLRIASINSTNRKKDTRVIESQEFKLETALILIVIIF